MRASLPLSLRVWVGVGYPPADRLASELIEAEWYGCVLLRDAGGLCDPPRDSAIRIETAEQVLPALDAIMALVDANAVPFALAYTNLDAMLSGLEHPPQRPAANRWDPPMPLSALGPAPADPFVSLCALLACAGHRRRLSELLAGQEGVSLPGEVGRERHRFVGRMVRWLEGELTLPSGVLPPP